MSSLAQPAAERPEVAVVRHPIADARNNVVGYELRFGGSIDLGGGGGTTPSLPGSGGACARSGGRSRA